MSPPYARITPDSKPNSKFHLSVLWIEGYSPAQAITSSHPTKPIITPDLKLYRNVFAWMDCYQPSLLT